MKFGKFGRIAGITLGAIVLAVVLFLIAIWFAFVPSASGPGYVFVRSWGSEGSAPGQFRDPTGIAIANNDLFVADARHNRIEVFDLNGHFLRAFGHAGKALGELGRPMMLTVHDDALYVPEYFNDRVQVFTLDGTPLHTLGHHGSGPGEFNAAGGVGVDAKGNVYVADFYNMRVQELAPDGTFLRQWGTTKHKGHGAGDFIYPTDVAIATDGRMYVADGYANRIQVFDANGRYLFKWGGPFAIGIPGGFPGWFRVVTGIAIGPRGNVFATDFYNHRVQVFDAQGRFLTAFGRFGHGASEFDHPIGVAVAPDGDVYVTDFGNDRVEEWRPGR